MGISSTARINPIPNQAPYLRLLVLDSAVKSDLDRPDKAKGSKKIDEVPKPIRKGDGSTGGPPDNRIPTVLKSPLSSPVKKSTFLPILLTAFLASTGLATLTHLKEDFFGRMTKALKIILTFGSMFTGTAAIADILATERPEETGDFSQALH
ncbi:MAG: hypothetical protein HY094_02885 [Candidatus Melainabacteria bacterium]|nr:hypothetical protein [Candidatus Melainabacteria bacterium]